MENDNIYTISQADDETAKILGSHDFRTLLKRVGQAGTYRFKSFPTEYGNTVGTADYHQLCRYLIAPAEQNITYKEYILAEVLSKLASSLGATAVLVDLRAGISEYSAPLLLDPRVKKYCVTSTSLQSVMGTKQVLSFIAKGLKIKEDTLLPNVFLGMIPETFSRREKQKIKENLLGCFETTEVKEELLDNMIVELPFASELIHLTEWKQILNVLKDRDMYDAVKELVKPYCISEEPERGIYTEKQHQIITKQICDFANTSCTGISI